MISNEDRLRLDSVRSNHIVKRETGSNGNNLDVFLEQARSTLSFSFQKDNDPRILDLINKTNQFNLNGNRYTQAALRRFIDDHSAFVLKASYEDRYGPLGKIAAIAGRTNGNFLFIDCWVMSCRAFSRRIEHACLDQLFREFEVETLEFDFRTTDRNEPLRKFFCEFLGAEPASRFRLSRKQFLEKCPQLFHKNEETSHG
jgi:FkbH-like protein